MKAYKFWNDKRYWIHKDTSDQLDLKWTEDINEAKDILPQWKGFAFFFDKLGFSINLSKPDPLYIT